jgi:hypothetical protein
VGRLVGILGQLPLEVLTPFAVARPFDLSLQLAVLAFLLIHGCSNHS